METLTTTNLVDLVGKKIKWQAPSANGNAPYGGEAILTSVDTRNARPIKADILSGDPIDKAILDLSDTGKLLTPEVCYSDLGRIISFEAL